MKSGVHTERGQSPEYILKVSKKNTIFNEHPVPNLAEGVTDVVRGCERGC